MVSAGKTKLMQRYQVLSSVVPEAGLEPARAVKPEGF